MNIDIQIAFDGKPPQEFAKAIEQVKKAVYRPNPKLRQILLKPLSDFFSGDATIEPGFEYLMPFKGFLGDRSKQVGNFAVRDSAPDIFAKIEDLRPIYGDKVVNELVEAQRERGATGVVEEGLVTLELKQAIVADKSSESITQQTPGQEVIKSLRQRVTDATKKAGTSRGVNKKILQDWFLTQADPAYRKQVGQVFNQKITNLLFITRVDGKASSVLVPGAAGKLQIFNKSGGVIKGKGEANFRSYIDPQFTKGDGSIVFKLNTQGMKFLEKAGADTTNEMTKAIAENFPTQLITFFTKGKGKGAVSKFVQGNVNGFTQVFAELLLVASEFDSSVGGKEFVYSFATDKKAMGAIASKVNLSKIQEPKKKKSEKQELISEIQLTTLVQRAMKQRMPQGQPGGPPDPTPGILTSRTGRFVQSTLVTSINKRRQEVLFRYDPIYAIHEDKYKVSLLISNSIREVAQRVFGKKYYPMREKRL